MEKRTYIQPEMKVAVMPKYAMMGFIPSPTDGSQDPTAPKRVVTPTNPVMPADTVQVF